MKVDAVILAGGKLKDSQEDKALIKLGDQTIIDRMIAILRECPPISKLIVASAPKSYKPKLDVDDLLVDTGDLIENIAAALKRVDRESALLVASDIPLIEAEHVSDFIDLCSKTDASLHYPLIPKSAMGKFGSMKRTYFKLDRTEFTGGNFILIKTDVFFSNLELAKKIYMNRKSPLKLGRLLGPRLLASLAFGRLSVEQVEGKASKILGAKIKGVIIRHPEIGSDIDKKEDLEFIERIIENG